jgi:hypothetical protein
MPQVRVSSNARDLSRRLHTAASDIPEELAAAARRAMGPPRDKLRGSALRTLPRRGGLNREVAFNTKFRTYRIPNGARIVAQSRYDIVAMNYGSTIHPLFGNKEHWYREDIREGWWDRVISQVEPAARREMEQALENIKQKIEG